MQTFINEGKYTLLSKTDDIIWQIANAARTCTDSFGKQTKENDLKLVQNLINKEHGAMLEFADMSVKFENICRGFTHEMVRHRVASFAQRSTRYVNESNLEVVLPPHMVDDPSFDKLDETLQLVENAYRALKEAGWKNEDARQILPIATVSPICVKANMREWRHIFTMRCDKFAHWEIRTVMIELLKYCKENIPLIFDDFHIFELPNGATYARPIKTVYAINEIIRDYILAGKDIDKLLNTIDKTIETSGK